MATIKSKAKSITVIDGGSMEASAELGVLFGCLHGVCGKCATDVTSGHKNLTAPTHEEHAMDLPDNRRLLCQCQITKGTVALDLA